MNKSFPQYQTHEEVRCFNCGETHSEVDHVESGNAIGRGRYRKQCPSCGLLTYYDLVERGEAMTANAERKTFLLPGNPGDKHVLPLSGGADSTYLAILMTQMFPDVDFEYVYTETGAEKDISAVLDRLEIFLDRKITRIGDRSLFDLVVKYGNFLPSAQSRYCTRELKLAPLEHHLRQYRDAGRKVHTYVGIRADEPWRSGMVSGEDWIETHLPLKELGIVREDVFRGLADTVGVPRMYRTRSRSGCSCCPFMRRSEVVGGLQQSPDEFLHALQFEKLSEEDVGRFRENAVKVSTEATMGENWLGFPVPDAIDVRTSNQAMPLVWGRLKRTQAPDLFDAERMATLWVGVEFFIDPNVGGSGVWQQRLVTWSTSRDGLCRQLQNVYELHLSTPEVFDMDAEEMRRCLRFGIYLIQVPESLMDTQHPSKGSYTWQPGQAYRQIIHLHAWCTRVLQVAALEREMETLRHARHDSVEHEWFEGAERALAKVVSERGRMLGMDRFVPSEVSAEEPDERFVTCFACSI